MTDNYDVYLGRWVNVTIQRPYRGSERVETCYDGKVIGVSPTDITLGHWCLCSEGRLYDQLVKLAGLNQYMLTYGQANLTPDKKRETIQKLEAALVKWENKTRTQLPVGLSRTTVIEKIEALNLY